jgi:hypothetical protein
MSHNISIYIPYVHISCTEQEIKNVFKTLLIGEVERVDFIVKNNNLANYFMCFVHFKEVFDNQATNNIIQKLENGEEARIVYNDPYYWALYKNKNPSSNNLEEKLDCAFMMIEDLQSTVLELKRTISNLENDRTIHCPSPVRPITINFDNTPPTSPIDFGFLQQRTPAPQPPPPPKPFLKRSRNLSC